MTRMHFTRLAWELRQSNPRVEAIHDPASDTYFWRMRQWENDVTAIAAACAASRSGMVAAIRAAVDGAGDFISARLTADSFVMVEHRRLGPPDGTVRSWARRVEVCDLPSLADYVDAAAYAFWPED